MGNENVENPCLPKKSMNLILYNILYYMKSALPERIIYIYIYIVLYYILYEKRSKNKNKNKKNGCPN